MSILERLLHEDYDEWERLIYEYEQVVASIKVPPVEKEAIHHFAYNVEETYTRAVHDFSRAKRNKDAITRLLKNVLENLYKGGNELARKAGGIQLAQNFPTPDDCPVSHVNLFDLEDRINGIYYSIQATVQSLQAKADAKITVNSLLNYDKSLLNN